MAGKGDILVLEGVSAGYGRGAAVLKDISLSIGRGEVAGLATLDAGGGKSTLIRVAAGLLSPRKGRVLFDGEDVYAMGYAEDQTFRGRFAVVFEGGALLVNRTIWDNVALPLRYHGVSSGRELKVTVERLLAQCGYNERLDAFPWQITERNRRLAAFARALARDPEFVIVDRFFEGLEMPDWRRLFELVMELNQNMGVSWLLMSELDPAIFQVAERVAILEEGQVLGFDFKKRLYEDARIKAAFSAAEIRSGSTRRFTSDRILVVDTDEEMELFDASGSSPLDTATPDGGPDPQATIAIDGVMGEQIRAARERTSPSARIEVATPLPPRREEEDSVDKTITLEQPLQREPEPEQEQESESESKRTPAPESEADE